MKEYKIQKKEIEAMDFNKAVDYLDKKSVEYKNKAAEFKAKATDDYDAPIREYWSYMAAHTGIEKLIEQYTSSDTKTL